MSFPEVTQQGEIAIRKFCVQNVSTIVISIMILALCIYEYYSLNVYEIKFATPAVRRASQTVLHCYHSTVLYPDLLINYYLISKRQTGETRKIFGPFYGHEEKPCRCFVHRFVVGGIEGRCIQTNWLWFWT